jgi:hypothetical protein
MTLVSNTPGLVPHPKKGVALNDNYLSFTGGGGAGDSDTFAQQYLPELYEAEVERYGNRTIGGFLRMVGAEMPMTSDQVVWSEQNRLHVSYDNCSFVSTGAYTTNTLRVQLTAADDNMAIKVGNTVVIQGEAGELVARINAITDNTTPANSFDLEAEPYEYANLDALYNTGNELTVFVFGSEYKKGSDTSGANAISTITPNFTQYDNKPIIIRDQFTVNGSDAAQIGWVEVATEDGTSGYLWYMKAESETRLRFEDYLEMTMVESVKKDGGTSLPADITGSEGLFAAIKDRGNLMDNFAGAAGGVGGLADFDEILKQLDKEGAIEENMLFLNRSLALEIDDMLGQVNGATQGNNLVGASFGLFDNESEMALNLGFSGFRRGSYDFYKTDWKYLNDAATRGVAGLNFTPTEIDGADLVEGVLVPAGTSTVYDQILGQNIRRPFLHVRYRASETDDRRMKSWVTGSVGGAFTSGLDAMEVHFLSERCLCVQGANNFVLFRS